MAGDAQRDEAFNPTRRRTIPVTHGHEPSISRYSYWRRAAQLAPILAFGVIGSAVMLAVLVSLVFPAWHAVRTRIAKQTCRGNLVQIGEALRQYEQVYGCFPPAFLADENGKPAHSWRVLILPYLGRQDLYRQYRFDEPWDGPTNSRLARQMPDVYACPSDIDAAANGETTYFVIVGKQSAFQGAATRRRQEILDDWASVLLVVESPASGCGWLEPRDIDATFTNLSVNNRSEGGIGSFHGGGAYVLTADGRARFLDNSAPPEIVAAMSTVDGRESIPAAPLAE